MGGKPTHSERNLTQCHWLHRKTHMACYGVDLATVHVQYTTAWIQATVHVQYPTAWIQATVHVQYPRAWIQATVQYSTLQHEYRRQHVQYPAAWIQATVHVQYPTAWIQEANLARSIQFHAFFLSVGSGKALWKLCISWEVNHLNHHHHHHHHH